MSTSYKRMCNVKYMFAKLLSQVQVQCINIRFMTHMRIYISGMHIIILIYKNGVHPGNIDLKNN